MFANSAIVVFGALRVNIAVLSKHISRCIVFVFMHKKSGFHMQSCECQCAMHVKENMNLQHFLATTVKPVISNHPLC